MFLPWSFSPQAQDQQRQGLHTESYETMNQNEPFLPFSHFPKVFGTATASFRPSQSRRRRVFPNCFLENHRGWRRSCGSSEQTDPAGAGGGHLSERQGRCKYLPGHLLTHHLITLLQSFRCNSKKKGKKKKTEFTLSVQDYLISWVLSTKPNGKTLSQNNIQYARAVNQVRCSMRWLCLDPKIYILWMNMSVLPLCSVGGQFLSTILKIQHGPCWYLLPQH